MIRNKLPTAMTLSACLLSAPAASARDIRLFEPDFAPAALLGKAYGAHIGDGLQPFFGLWVDFADDEIVAIERTRGDGTNLTDRRVPIIDDRLGFNVGAGLGFLSVASVSLVMPVLLTRADGESRATAAGDLRVQGRLRVAGEDDRGFGLEALFGMTLPTGPADGWDGLGAVSGSVGFGVHWLSTDGHVLAFSFQWRFRPESAWGDSVLGDDLRFGMAGKLAVSPAFALLGELDGLIAASGTATRLAPDVARATPIEGRLGFALVPGAGFELKAFSGAGLTAGLGAPDFRVGFGIAWRPVQEVEAPPETLTSNVPDGDSPTEGTPTESIASPKAPVDAAAFAAALAKDPDADADGISACAAADTSCTEPWDRCPDAPEDFDGHEDGDGCPDPDNDGDGIPDDADRCPGEAETFNGRDDEDGCPDGDPADAGGPSFKEENDEIAVGDIPFRSGSDQFTGDAAERLRDLATFLKNRTRIRRLVIEGHTDNQGDKEFNVDLSERRAASVRAFLIAEGVEGTRLLARGYGATRPVASNGNDAGRARNRRVVFRIDRDFQLRTIPAGSK